MSLSLWVIVVVVVVVGLDFGFAFGFAFACVVFCCVVWVRVWGPLEALLRLLFPSLTVCPSVYLYLFM